MTTTLIILLWTIILSIDDAGTGSDAFYGFFILFSLGITMIIDIAIVAKILDL